MHKKQLTIEFPEAPDQGARERRRVAEAIATRRSGRKIHHLMATGTAADTTEAQELIVVQCIHRHRRGLREFVECLSQGELAKNTQQQADAESLDREFHHLSDLELAHRLIALGLCDGTDTYPRDTGVHRYALWSFRTAMIQAGLWKEEEQTDTTALRQCHPK